MMRGMAQPSIACPGIELPVAWRSMPFRSLSFDRPLHAALARLTGGVSPAALTQEYVYWAPHFLLSLDKQLSMAERAVRSASRWFDDGVRACVDLSAWGYSAVHHDGSWWPCWQAWLVRRSSGHVTSPPMGGKRQGQAPFDEAPGSYVRRP